MPRTSKDALAVAHIGPGAWRLDPPAELGEVEAAIFRQTVASQSRHPNNSRSSKPTVAPSYYQLMDQQSPKGS